MSDVNTEIYGRGWAFPPEFSPGQGVKMAEGAEDVRQSLRILFSTLPGERIMRPDYGCDLHAYMFENIRAELIAELSVAIADSILRDEERADVESVNIEQDSRQPERLLVQVNYRLSGGGDEQQWGGVWRIGDGQGVSYI